LLEFLFATWPGAEVTNKSGASNHSINTDHNMATQHDTQINNHKDGSNCHAMNEIKISQAGQPAKELLQRPSNPRHRILVVESDDMVRRFNTELLTQFGYQVDAVADGSVAWDTIQSQTYHLVVTDNDVPKVTGVDLLKKLHAARMALPVVMTATTLPKEDFTQCSWLLPAALLLEPYQAHELVVTVQEVLRASQ
jgi:CheY-like chemotaxis protein